MAAGSCTHALFPRPFPSPHLTCAFAFFFSSWSSHILLLLAKTRKYGHRRRCCAVLDIGVEADIDARASEFPPRAVEGVQRLGCATQGEGHDPAGHRRRTAEVWTALPEEMRERRWRGAGGCSVFLSGILFSYRLLLSLNPRALATCAASIRFRWHSRGTFENGH